MKFMLLVLLATTVPFLSAQEFVGKAAPDFSVNSTIGETELRKLKDYAGDVVVLRFTCT
ncbi:MAG: peroxiredoxin family protein [Planctomycetes bacterium]|nr:peroxiredoxin family protein [Planctomycetota bacterium]